MVRPDLATWKIKNEKFAWEIIIIKFVPTPLILWRYIIRKRFQSLSCTESMVLEKSCPKVGKGWLHPRFARGLLAGSARKWPDFWSFWWHIFAPNSQQSAGIALKTSPIESYQFSTSKLCTNFFSNSNTKIIFFGLKKNRFFFRAKKYFRDFPENRKIWSNFFSRKFQQQKNGKIFFARKYFRKYFFIPELLFFWLELEKKLVHSFYVENW